MTAGSTRSMALADVSATDTDTDTTVKVAFDKLPSVSGSYAIVGSRHSGRSGYRAKVKVDSAGGLQLILPRVVNGTETTMKTVTLTGATLTPNAQLATRLQTLGSVTPTLQARAWLVGTAEPTAWQATTTDTTAALPNSGGVYLSTFIPSTSDVSLVGGWDDLAVTTL